MSDLDSMPTFDKDTILRHLLFKLSPELRRELMREYPGAYNRMVRRDIVAVHYFDSDHHMVEGGPR